MTGGGDGGAGGGGRTLIFGGSSWSVALKSNIRSAYGKSLKLKTSIVLLRL